MTVLTTLAASTHEYHFAWSELWRVLVLTDYNTRLVVLSTALLGMASGVVGSFLLLRKRSLMGDVISHAASPGIPIAFMVMLALGGSGKALPGLLAGATITGLIGVGLVMTIRNTTRLKDDAAMGMVLSVLFGLGMALYSLAQDMAGSGAGLQSFIYGKTASMVWNDFLLIAGVAVVVAGACALMFKELTLLCFDDDFAGALGWPVRRLDAVLLAMVTAVTVIGLQAVGLILIIAMLIIPPAAARFWTERLWHMTFIAAAIGVASGWLGASASAILPNLPAGAVIVLVAAGIFTLSMIFGTSRGVVVRALRHVRLNQRIRRQHLLRAVYELTEDDPQHHVTVDVLLRKRSWTRRSLRRRIRAAVRDGLIRPNTSRSIRLTEEGRLEAARVVRNHRLWEMYLIAHADIAPSHVDRDADMIEHVLSSELIARLEAMVEHEPSVPAVPTSPHALAKPEVAGEALR